MVTRTRPSRADRARQIPQWQIVWLGDDCYQVPSQTRNGSYLVSPDDCECVDSQREHRCKHQQAVFDCPRAGCGGRLLHYWAHVGGRGDVQVASCDRTAEDRCDYYAWWQK